MLKYKKEGLTEHSYHVMEQISEFSQVIVIIFHCSREQTEHHGRSYAVSSREGRGPRDSGFRTCVNCGVPQVLEQ